MKESGLRPSSVTYGAVIGACCRVGDEESAMILFDEMVSMPNFKPRVPPYNTMIQFFTQTKPNRERALHYYNAMLSAGVSPSAHTYKLLIDVYGAVEPIEMDSTQTIFDQLVADHSVPVQGTHWASLINAWGCVGRDLDRAIAVFESIASHPSTKRSKTPLPDAVVYESLINVFVTLHRMDLVPVYLQRLQESNIHATAYIMNLLIKGYASTGNMEKAREIFASLQDPEMGVAAPNNHASHDGTVVSTPSGGVVYREPSTWEAMVRAELGASERERAAELLDRMETRMFPPAVTSRIRGIMRDETVI
jgi:pentatricopeptide repeat protein